MLFSSILISQYENFCNDKLWVVTILKIFYLFIFRERGREGEREKHRRAKHEWAESRTPTSGVSACNPGMCRDWESNQQHFSAQASTQSTEPYRPGLC